MAIQRFLAAFLFSLIITASVYAADPKPSMPVPDGYKLLYVQNFDDASALKGFQFSDRNAWRFNKEGNGSATIKNSDGDEYNVDIVEIAMLEISARLRASVWQSLNHQRRSVEYLRTAVTKRRPVQELLWMTSNVLPML